MERKKVISFSDSFFKNLEEFGLDFDEIKQKILFHVDEKEKDFSLDKRMLFYTPYIKDGKKYMLAGYVTKKEKSILIEASSIWDKGFNPEDIIVIKETNIRVIK
ncbi:hypothetical protein Cst_c18070 [Thermoclostridium stercorarium subsp. stercorarium DSM 8532]|uniref:Uncharacterized protein n=1 Tax=Thermoclostridium stercorarium (strain ATCC 35414 / DSM 8532 / NCIMB 11754) TaxID=1121335 RepID=L7VKW9_THES1|nr:hypothetical protein [Thermoclostridium stercorarium]AGC68785.1 hypothetical protein Cst_c18070 [Thermoclostridium stercorarium subsp. stercorarium DSM 8532]